MVGCLKRANNGVSIEGKGSLKYLKKKNSRLKYPMLRHGMPLSYIIYLLGILDPLSSFNTSHKLNSASFLSHKVNGKIDFYQTLYLHP